MTSAPMSFSAAGPLGRQWLAVACSGDVQDTPVAVRLLASDLVLWRSPSGTVVAAPDRCTHSKRPLSKGAVNDGLLVCAKHGWTFGDEGRCVLKPSGLPITDNAHLKTYPCTERYGVIWVSLAEPDMPVIDLAWAGDERYRRIHSGVSVWQCDPIKVIESVLAQSNFGFVDVVADLPFSIHAAFNSDNTCEHRRLLTCAPIDARTSLVTSVVWTSSGQHSDDAVIVSEAMADLDELKSAAEAAGATSSAAGAAPDDEAGYSDWKRRLLAFAGQGA
jgi:nitrite reductase/ring-hydroxylating ferredoxin subunit